VNARKSCQPEKVWSADSVMNTMLVSFVRKGCRPFILAAPLLAAAALGFEAPAERINQPAPGSQPSDSENATDQETARAAPPRKFRPRTLPQAIRVYLHCLHCPPPNLELEKKQANGGGSCSGQTGSDEKLPPTAVRAGDQQKGGSKQPGSDAAQAQTDIKSPPAAGKQPGDQDKGAGNEGEGDKKEEGKEGNQANGGKEEEKEPEIQWYSSHAQATVVTQKHGAFRSPYIGPNSLLPEEPAATSETSTIFLDVRLWEWCGQSTELIFDPEIAGGTGFSGVTGIAGFPNEEITRVGNPDPTPYIARLMLRQTWGLGGEQEKIEDDVNQIAGKRDIDRIVLTVGKMASTDVADDNRYAHDARTQFLNWALTYNGAWDYPANVRGYSYGIGLDFNTKYWAIHYGIFAEPEVANGAPLDPHFLEANGQVWEWEQRYWLWEHPGHLRPLFYLNRAHMGDYREALQQMPVDPNVTLTREYRYKYGFGLSWDQEITKDLGLFGRLGWNDGHTETWAFTAIDRTASLGLALKGRCWCRPNDTVALAGLINGLAKDHRDYLAAGGLDFIIGDGRLNYGHEQILEFYYNFQIIKGIFAAFDFQEVNHPAYNKDRGPVSIGTLRAHLEF
jgi:high affinity Mn2+ porin